MVEESKDKPSPQKTSEEEKKPVPPVPPVPKPAVAPTVPAPRPPVAPPKPAAQPQAPASRPPAQPQSAGRRNFVKAMLAIGAVLSVTPFIPWGPFLSKSVSGGGTRHLLQKLVIDDNVLKYPAAHGMQVNVNDLNTFPVNSHWVVTYPTSGDLTVDAQSPDTFQKYELIRLPGAAGSTKTAADFVAFSKVCVHLWCSPNYNPTQIDNPQENGYVDPTKVAPGQKPPTTHEQYECPCHGSIYRVPDGKAVEGPASLQPAPTNAIPMLTLQADSGGNLYAYYPNYDPSTKAPVADSIEANGELGFGRDFNSYLSFLKPKAQIVADPKDLTTVVG